MCCEPSGYNKNEINGECPKCQAETIDGDAYENCGYSETLCELCGWSPCDGSC